MRGPAVELFRHVTANRLRASTTVEVIQEFVHVRSRRRPRREAVRQARRVATGLAPLWLTDPVELDDGLRLYEEVPSLGAFDAVLAGVARARGAILVSADRGFAAAPGLDFLPLDGPELAAVLDGSG